MTDVPLRVLAVVADAASRAVIEKVLPEHVVFTDELSQAVPLAEAHTPSIAFVEVGLHDGAGLALVHHLKAIDPSLPVYALAARRSLETAANAIALGGAGLIIMPPGGDEILTALEAVRDRRVDEARRRRNEASELAYATLATWRDGLRAVAEAPNRNAAATRLLALLAGDEGKNEVAIYLAMGSSDGQLLRVAASEGLGELPEFVDAEELADLVRRAGLHDLPVAASSGITAHLCLRDRGPLASPAVADLFAAQLGLALVAVGERERGGGATIKDPGSSAYSFAYYADVAGREITRAQRYGRRFAIATIGFDRSELVPPLTHAEMADQILKAASDTDVLAQVDEHDFQLLLPETDGLGAHAARRRVIARIAERVGRTLPMGLRLGFASYPHDGTDLSRLLRAARRRADATRYSLVGRFAPDQSGLADLLDAASWDLEALEPEAIFAARRFELPGAEAAALGRGVVMDALRGGSVLVVMAANDETGIGSAVKAALPTGRDNVTVHVVDVRAVARCEDLEAVAILAEHGTYAMVGRNQQGVVHGLHAADPLLADVLAERLGRAAGLRLFT